MPGVAEMTLRVAMLDPSAFTIPYDLHLCRALRDAGTDVTFFTRSPRSVEGLSWSLSGSADDTQPGFDTVEHFYRISERLPLVSAVPPLRMGLKAAEHVLNMASLCRILHRLRPDVIHFQWMALPPIDRRFLRRLRTIAPCVLTVHDANGFLVPSSRFQKAGWRQALLEFDHLIVHTQAGKQALLSKGVEERKISVIPHGVFHYSADGVEDVDNDTESDTCLLLAFGSIRPYKGLDVLIRALAELPEATRSKVRLIVAGDPGSMEKELRALAVECGVHDLIKWDLRYIPDEEVPAVFQRCNVVVFPYREIDASGALMTGLPYAKAIVASRLGLFDELLENGETALLVEPDDPTALASALATIAEDPALAREMGHRAANLANDVCSWDSIAALSLNAYHEASRSDDCGIET
jgi:glycosyltransferase involved in cell wall biosynthesis